MIATATGFFVAGTVLLLAALSVLQDGDAAPRWVLAVCAAVFLLASALALSAGPGGLRGRAVDVVGCVIVLLFAVLANWTAFGPGDRSGSFGIALPVLATGSPASQTTIRIAFAVSALVLDALSIAIVVKVLRWALRRPR